MLEQGNNPLLKEMLGDQIHNVVQYHFQQDGASLHNVALRELFK